jgi:outer membrane biosynthesis protein TonB
MWAVLYDDGTSLTTVSEPIARSLAEAERQRGHRVTIRRLDDDPESAPEPEPIRRAERFARPEPISEPEPAPAPEPVQTVEPVQKVEPAQTVEPTLAPEPAQTVEPAQIVEPAQAVEPAPVPTPDREPEPGRAVRPARGRRLLLYALSAGCIVVAAAMADHWDALPRVGATTSSSPAQVSSPSRPQLLPPLDQPPVMHFGNAVRARSRGG